MILSSIVIVLAKLVCAAAPVASPATALAIEQYPLQINAGLLLTTCAIHPLAGESGKVTVLSTDGNLSVGLRLPNGVLVTPASVVPYGCEFELIDRTTSTDEVDFWLWPFPDSPAPGLAVYTYTLPPTISGRVQVEVLASSVSADAIPAFIEFAPETRVQLIATGSRPFGIAGRPFTISAAAVLLGAAVNDDNAIVPITEVRSIAVVPGNPYPEVDFSSPVFLDNGLMGDAVAGDHVHSAIITPSRVGELTSMIRVIGQHNGETFVRDGIVSATVLADLGRFRRPPADDPNIDTVTAMVVDKDNNQLDDTVVFDFPAIYPTSTNGGIGSNSVPNLRMFLTLGTGDEGDVNSQTHLFELSPTAYAYQIGRGSFLRVDIAISELLSLLPVDIDGSLPSRTFHIVSAELLGIDPAWGMYSLDELDAPIASFSLDCLRLEGFPRFRRWDPCTTSSWIFRDNDNDGLFDELLFKIWIITPRGESLRSTVTIKGQCGVTIGTYTVYNNFSASCGLHLIEFVIPAADIVRDGIDGPYIAQWLSVDRALGSMLNDPWLGYNSYGYCTKVEARASDFSGYRGFVDRNHNDVPDRCEIYDNPGLDANGDGQLDNPCSGLPCLADVASDGSDTSPNPNCSVGPEDLEAFINAYLSGNLAIADIASDSGDTSYNPNGSIGPEDLEAFINSLLNGCSPPVNP